MVAHLIVSQRARVRVPCSPQIEGANMNISRDEFFDLLKDGLTLEVKDGDFTDPNRRIIQLKYDGCVFAEVSFDVIQKPEYEG